MTRLRRHPDLAVVAIAAAIFVAAGGLLQTVGVPLRAQEPVTAVTAPSPTLPATRNAYPVPASPPPSGTTLSAEVVVYGSTPSGIVAAVSAAREGASVVVISPDDRVGGMMTSGLSHADAGRKDLIGGLPLEVFRRIGRLGALEEFATREGEAAAAGPVPPVLGAGAGWDAEPHIVQAAFEQLLGDANVPVFLDQHLDRTQQLPIANGRITALRTIEGLTVQSDVFIDATYEGDLMAAAGVPFAIGREASRTYGEAL